MTLREFNEIFTSIDDIPSKYPLVSETVETEEDEETYTRIYNVYQNDENGDQAFLKMVFQTDSYGERERLISMSFCKPVEKVVTGYEAV